MKNLEEYKKLSYKAVVQYDPDEDSYFVEFPELPGCMADAATAPEAIEKALKVKDEWLEIAFDAGYKIPEPVEKLETTGRQTVRMPKSLHARVIKRAEDEGVSQNQLILSFISEGLARTTSQEDIRKELAEFRTLRETLTNLLANASSTFANPFADLLFSASSWNQNINQLWLGINANTVRAHLFEDIKRAATNATADITPVCRENLSEETRKWNFIATTEESYQGGYQS